MAVPTSLRMHVIKSLCGNDMLFLNSALQESGVLESDLIVIALHRS